MGGQTRTDLDSFFRLGFESNEYILTALAKLYEAGIVVGAILLLMLVWGRKFSDLYLRRGRFGVAIFVGSCLFLLNTATAIVTGSVQGQAGDPEEIKAHIADIKSRREKSQPIREKTGGSTFANPSAEELSQSSLPTDTKVWQLIDRAGCRGLTIGGAQMSEKHSNFMINTGDATAEDLETLGEMVRKKVYENSGLTLEWEIMRVGEPRAK